MQHFTCGSFALHYTASAGGMWQVNLWTGTAIVAIPAAFFGVHLLTMMATGKPILCLTVLSARRQTDAVCLRFPVIAVWSWPS